MKKYFLPIICMLIFSACSSRSTTSKSSNLQPYITFISIKQIEFTDVDGMAWDADGSGPDMRAVLYRQGNTDEVFSSPVAFNIKSINLPVKWSLADYNQALGGQQWRLVLFDIDDNSRQEMKRWNFDGNVSDGNIFLSGGDNSVYDVEIGVDYRKIQ